MATETAHCPFCDASDEEIQLSGSMNFPCPKCGRTITLDDTCPNAIVYRDSDKAVEDDELPSLLDMCGSLENESGDSRITFCSTCSASGQVVCPQCGGGGGSLDPARACPLCNGDCYIVAKDWCSDHGRSQHGATRIREVNLEFFGEDGVKLGQLCDWIGAPAPVVIRKAIRELYTTEERRHSGRY